MAIQGVDLKCYILALFIRDDGERFLLGSGRYEFKDKQRHFAANTMQNDVVEVQGNDGFLLAGQVKRPGSQSFDGYVGDGTTSKQEVEEYRRDFFSFFRKNFFYQVIYIFPDGTAIQRKRGFLVDAPTVQELYQIYPEYHVALNFEDVNYYSYSENASGEEEFAKSATISLSAGGSSGGLVWDELGAVAEGFQWGEIVTATGTEITVQNDSEGALPITDAKMYGDTVQSGTPTPDSPQPIQTVTGRQLVTVTNGSTSEEYEINLGKNLLDNKNPSLIGQNVTWQPNDTGGGSVSAGYPTSKGVRWYFEVEAGKPYTFSGKGSRTTGLFIADFPDSSFTTYKTMLVDNKSMTGNYTFVPTTRYVCVTYYMEAYDSFTVNNLQFEAGPTTTPYAPYFDPIELCKIGNAQDYIYRSGGEWYLRKRCSKAILDGSESWTESSTQGTTFIRGLLGSFAALNSQCYCDQFTYRTGSHGSYEYIWIQDTTGNLYLQISDSRLSAHSLAAFKDWLAANKPAVYYILANPTDILITNQALIEDLNRLAGVSFPAGESQLVVSASGNLVGELEISYYGSVDFEGGGFVWEEGGPSGPTTVEVDSIENVYPIWEVKGPATNPQLSVITTNTTLRYNGTVAAGQTLAIDMMSKTAKLNGTSVIGNVSGEWVNFVPGNNRVVYTTNNANAESSTIYWQEVVG